VPSYQFTVYFENEVMRKRPYLTEDMCIRVVRSPFVLSYRNKTGIGSGAKSRSYRADSCVVTLSDKLYNTQCVFRPEVQTLKLNYYPDTDSLYIDLSSKPGTESREVSEGVILDYDADGKLVGIDIDNASRKLDLRELVTNQIPVVNESV
jgi:uncharacterized protein YuzE